MDQLSSSESDIFEKPQNGLAGLKHWRHDVVAGLLVSLVSLPLSIGIAIASGAPPITGLISAIVAGLLLPFLGGSNVTISGPAAGLAPVLLASMAALGHGSKENGYHFLLAVICVAGVIQIILSLFKAARLSALFPASVVEGMLAAIGMLIIVKQLGAFMGFSVHAHEFHEILYEAVTQAPTHAVAEVFALGAICLALTFLLGIFKLPGLKKIPPPLLVVIVGIALGQILRLDAKYLIKLPDNPLHGFAFPDFTGLIADRSLWWTAISVVVTLTLIDGIESLATIMAVDKIDPFHRKSDPNRTLLAMGISNICSSIVGGLTIIPGGVKSKACIVGGGRTLWANFYNAIFLIIFLFVAKDLINLIPLSALAAILIYTGWKLCEPKVWLHIAHIGREQLIPFTVTIVGSLAIDLLWGIGLGMLSKLLMNVVLANVAAQRVPERHKSLPALLLSLPNRIRDQFRNPIVERALNDNDYHLFFGYPIVCFNTLAVSRELARIPPQAQHVFLHVTRDVLLIDHTSCENLVLLVSERNAFGPVHFELVDFEQLQKKSRHSTGLRLLPRTPVSSASAAQTKTVTT